MIKKSPMQAVLEKFGKTAPKDADRETRRKAKDDAKQALANQLADVLERPEGEEKDAFQQRLSFVSSRKLLNLLKNQEKLKKDFGSKNNLVEAILAKQNRSKDEDYRKKLLGLSVSRLLSIAPKIKA